MENLIAPLALIFTALLMLSASLATSDQDIRRVFRERRLLARAFLANVVIVPILAVVLRQACQLEGDVAMGAVLAAICPGAPFGTFLAGRSREDVALAVILTCGLTLIALVTAPITSWLVFGPDKMVALPRGFGLLWTALVILLPVALGRAVRRRSPVFAHRSGRVVGWLTLLCFVGVTLVASGLRSSGLHRVGWSGSALILAIVLASIGVGWLFGTSPGIRATLATSTSLRNVGIALIYANYSFPGTEVRLGVAAYSFLMLFPNSLFATLMRRRRARAGLS